MSKYTKFLEGLEDFTEETVDTLGFVAVRVAPLAGPTVSGMAIMFAFYDGGGALLTSRGIGGAYGIALAVGFFMMLALEGLTITHMILGDRIRAAIKRQPDLDGVLDVMQAKHNKTGLLWFTLTAIFLLETIPAFAEWWAGHLAPEVALFRVGLIVFPWLSRNAASAYSLMHTLEEVDNSATLARMERKKRRLVEKFDLEDVALERDRRRSLEDAKHAEKLGKVVSKPAYVVSKPSFPALVDNVAPEVDGKKLVDETTQETTEKQETKQPLGKQLVRYYLDDSNQAKTMDEVATEIGVSKSTISKEVSRLTDMGVFDKIKVGNRTTIKPNGNHEEYLAKGDVE